MKTHVLMGAGLVAALVVGYLAIDAVNDRRLTGTFNRIYADGA